MSRENHEQRKARKDEPELGPQPDGSPVPCLLQLTEDELVFGFRVARLIASSAMHQPGAVAQATGTGKELPAETPSL